MLWDPREESLLEKKKNYSYISNPKTLSCLVAVDESDEFCD